MSETSQPPPRRLPPYGWMPHPDFPGVRTPSSSTRAPPATAPVTVDKDGRSWRIGTADDVAWIAGHTIDGLTVTNAIPPRFDAYATYYQPEGTDITLHERTVVDILKAHTAEQPWWLGYLDTGAHDVVFNTVPKVTLYWGWRYVLVEAGPEQALTWRTGHMRGGLLGGQTCSSPLTAHGSPRPYGTTPGQTSEVRPNWSTRCSGIRSQTRARSSLTRTQCRLDSPANKDLTPTARPQLGTGFRQ
jgi:hypothetical protein